MSQHIQPVEHEYMHDAYVVVELHDQHVLTRDAELAFNEAWNEMLDDTPACAPHVVHALDAHIWNTWADSADLSELEINF